jgi:hypothetical protein
LSKTIGSESKLISRLPDQEKVVLGGKRQIIGKQSFAPDQVVTVTQVQAKSSKDAEAIVLKALMHTQPVSIVAQVQEGSVYVCRIGFNSPFEAAASVIELKDHQLSMDSDSTWRIFQGRKLPFTQEILLTPGVNLCLLSQ